MSTEDKLYKILPVYKKMPDWLKLVFVAPFKLFPRSTYLGKNYKNHYQELISMEKWNSNQVDSYNTKKIIELINHAYNNVPYYKETWDKLGVDIKQIHTLTDFKNNIPLLDKEDIQKNPEMFLAKNYSDEKIMEMNTGGSTGAPMKLFYTKGETRPAGKADIQFIHEKFGLKPNDRIARLRGDFLGKSVLSSYDAYRDVLMLSSFELKKNNVKQYIKLLEKYKISYLHGYPASIENLVKLATENKIDFKLKDFKGIIFASENVYKHQEELCINFFKTKKIFKIYGLTEYSALAFNCPKCDGYHFVPTHGYVEFIPKSVNGHENVNPIGEIVGTSFINPAFPLIRYKTNDLGELAQGDGICNTYHFPYLKNIIGREQDIAIGDDGREITLTALIFGRHAKYFDNVLKMQLINTQPGKLHVLVVPNNNYSKSDTKEIIRSLSKKEGMPFETTVEIVDNIAPTKSGKYKLFIRHFNNVA